MVKECTEDSHIRCQKPVQECKELGIETLTPSEIEDMKRKWFNHEVNNAK